MSTRKSTRVVKKLKVDEVNYDDYEFLEGDEESDPFETDGTEDEYTPDCEAPKKGKQPKQKELSKSDGTKGESPALEKENGGKKRRKVGSTGKKDEKVKLADFIKDEEVIYNLNHRLHSNLSAVSAAWDRVAKKMDKPGKLL